MKINLISYNVNGIRAALSKGLPGWLALENPDILCIQEIKAEESQINRIELENLGYQSFWFSANKKGYSGVGVLTKIEPVSIYYGIGIERYDIEGRNIRMDFEQFTLINSYFPSGTTGDIRQDFKMEYLNDFLKYTNELQNEKSNIIVSGDYNICHNSIDINHPEKHQKSSGFLPEEREWMDRFVKNGFIDSFRVFNQEPNQYSWWSYRANSRAKNLGWRIDYHMLTSSLSKNLIHAEILKDVRHSDHCPVKVVLKF